MRGGTGVAGQQRHARRSAGSPALCRLDVTAASAATCPASPAPCRSQGVAWCFSACNFDDFNGQADAADEVLAKRGIDLSKYKYK